mgnify:CR=1 FL=1
MSGLFPDDPPPMDCAVPPALAGVGFKASRARILYRFYERDDKEPEFGTVHGWAAVDGPWLHFLDDEAGLSEGWSTWPIGNVTGIDWQPPAGVGE